jgi:hypothetical protein
MNKKDSRRDLLPDRSAITGTTRNRGREVAVPGIDPDAP